MNKSEACFSAISLSTGVRNISSPRFVESKEPSRLKTGKARSKFQAQLARIRSFVHVVDLIGSVPAQQLVDARLRARFGVHLFHDHCAVQTIATVLGGQVSGDDHRAGWDAAVRSLLSLTVVDARALADVHAHRDDRAFPDDHTLDDL